MPAILLEVCVDSPRGLKAAIAGGADRIELCSSLPVGGLTPSPGFMALAARSARPSRAMIRPRVGDYVYSEEEVDIMRRDIDAARDAGLAGVVIGASLASGALDEKTIARLADHAEGLELTLNRTVDLSPEPLKAVDMAITIAAMVARAGDRLEILAGSGLNPDNVRSLVEKTGVRAVHGSFAAPLADIDAKLVRFGYIAADARDTSEELVRRARTTLS